ncbi:MAG: ABC transporter permease subunit [Myxococcales bacterium]|nr:ABC transporter permease subunit [Myxococcales bacterium]
MRRALSTHDGRVAVALLGFLAVLSWLVPLFAAPPDQSDFTMPLAPDGGPPLPTARSWLGGDALHRDVLSRLAAGGRVSLAVAGAAALVAGLVGVSVGITSATAARAGARRVDGLLMRLVDVLLALPFLLFVTTVGVLVGRTDPTSLVLVLGLTGWTGIARIIRARAMTVLGQDYVQAARALGASFTRVAISHVLPNVAPTAIVLGTSLVGSMILAEAVLGYLAVGIQPPQATWGRMLHEAESLVVLRPALVAAPGVCILVAMLGLHRLGEALRVATESSQAERSQRRFPVDVAVAAAALLVLALLPPKALPAPPAASGSAEPVRGGTLRLATLFTVRTLDPASAPDEISIALVRLVFDRLLTFDAEGRIAPALAERFEWSEDGLALDLYLRHGVRFQDGSTLGARDVKRSFERTLHPKAASPGASNFANLEGYEAYHSGKAAELAGVTVIDDHIVRFSLQARDSTLPSLLTLSFAAPVCPSVPFSLADTKDTDLCGAGPFRIERFEPEGLVRLARHAAYRVPGLPHLDGIELALQVRPQAQRFRFERGELDYVRELSGSDAMLFRADPRWAPHGKLVDSLRASAIFLNTEVAPFDDVRLRRVVSLAVDPSVLVKVRADLAPLARVVPDAVPGRRDPALERHHDPEAALALMAEAGYAFDPATGRGGYHDPIDYVTVPDTFEQSAAEIYQQQLARVGIRIRLRLLSHQTYLSEVQTRGKSAMGWAGWQADYPDPLTFFDPKLVSSAIGPVSQNNSFYSSPEVDALVARARVETDPRTRDEIFSRAEEIVHADAAWIPVSTARVFELSQPWLRGYEPTALVQLDFTSAFLDRPATDGQAARAALGMSPLRSASR